MNKKWILLSVILLTLIVCVAGYLFVKYESEKTIEQASLALFAEDENHSANKENLSSFITEDLDGNTVTESVFSDYSLTMVNIWTTWCGYCRKEMPELAQLYKQLPERVNLISICMDADEDAQTATAILEAAGADFVTLRPSTSLQELIHVQGYPTTWFLDRNGKIVGDAISGAPHDVISTYLGEINKCLSKIEGNN